MSIEGYDVDGDMTNMMASNWSANCFPNSTKNDPQLHLGMTIGPSSSQVLHLEVTKVFTRSKDSVVDQYIVNLLFKS